MQNTLLWIVTALYVGQCAVFIYNSNYSGAMIFAGYSFANVGVILAFSNT